MDAENMKNQEDANGMQESKEKTAKIPFANTASDNENAEPGLFIAGIGASAGGYEAIEEFFRKMPADSGIAFVVIQHLSPDFKSLMVELLSKQTDMAVFRAENGMKVEPNCVYLMQPKNNMTISDGRLYLSETDPSKGLNLPINIFFRSLAEDKQSESIGIILSGTGSDGTLGIRDIKGFGGMVMVQDTDSAKFDGMPASAINTGQVDYILPPKSMPEQLIAYVNHSLFSSKHTPGMVLGKNVDHMSTILKILRTYEKIDFSYYKPSTIIRRIDKRMSINQLDSLESYVELVRNSRHEGETLIRELLIGVTKFFRDTEAFDLLEKIVIPDLLQRKDEGEALRVWVTGCSTGEEVYSLAMLFREAIEAMKAPVEVKIFATDIDRRAIEFASAGIYPDSIIADVSQERLNRFFIRNENSYTVKEYIRKMVIFAHQNLIEDPPFNKIELITCRNILIYFQQAAQKRVLSYFHFALSKGGYLLLGKSETVGDMSNQFRTINARWKLYSKLGLHSYHTLHATMQLRKQERTEPAAPVAYVREKPTEESKFEKFYHLLMGRYEPSAILLNSQDEPEYIFGDANRFLNISKGKIHLNIHKLIKPDLSVVVSTGIRKARQTNKEVTYTDLILTIDGESKSYSFTALPAKLGDEFHGELFIIFDEMKTERVALIETQNGMSVEDISNEHIRNLEQELQFTKESLQATVEELETSNEELQATNEELLASNEELQSTNEELQSVNEELITVNSEYQRKIEELVDLNNDYDNLLSSTDIGTLFLDYQLRVRKFTPKLKEHLALLDADIGRPITNFNHRKLYDSFIDDLQLVLRTGKNIEKEVTILNNKTLLIKISAYHSNGRTSEGVVINFIDITRLRRLQDENKLLAKAIGQNPAMTLITDAEGIIRYVNDAFLEVTGYDRKEVTGRNVSFLRDEESEGVDFGKVWETISSGNRWKGTFVNIRKDGSRFEEEAIIVPLRDDDNVISNYVKVAELVTDS